MMIISPRFLIVDVDKERETATRSGDEEDYDRKNEEFRHRESFGEGLEVAQEREEILTEARPGKIKLCQD